MPEIRIRLYNTVKDNGGVFPVIISSLPYVSKHEIIYEKKVIMHHVTFTDELQIVRITNIQRSVLLYN